MRYLVRARLLPGKAAALLAATDSGELGRGSVAGGEYARDMRAARQLADGSVRWVEICFCQQPLAEERPYWEQYFSLDRVQDAHARSACRDADGSEPYACSSCDCTVKLDAWLGARGEQFLDRLRAGEGEGGSDRGVGSDPHRRRAGQGAGQ